MQKVIEMFIKNKSSILIRAGIVLLSIVLQVLTMLLLIGILKDYASSATDITDGLASELYEIKKDGFGFMIHEELFDISDEYKQIADEHDLDYLDLILHVGEDFELLFTISKENFEKLPIDCMVIGEVTDSDVIELTLVDYYLLNLRAISLMHLDTARTLNNTILEACVVT
mgnify:CR=1 FL=1